MRSTLAIVALVAAMLCSPVAAASPTAPAVRGPLTQACAPGTPIVVCICTVTPSRCYPGTYILKPR